MKRKKKRSLIPILCLLVAALALGYVVYYVTAQQQRSKVYEELQAEVRTEIVTEAAEPVTESVTEATPTEASEPVTEPEPEPEPYVSEIDFTPLLERNPDIYAWIEIPGTDVAYPILHGEYYLDHTVDRASGLPGAIFTDDYTSQDLSGFNAVIYGHNMKNGSMFGSLKKYRDEEYLNEHREIVIYTPTAKLTYTVFAAVVYDDRMIQSVFDETFTEDRQAFLDSIYSCRDMNSHVLEDVTVTPEDHIITLSTCISRQPTNRYLVVAVLTNEER